MDNEVDEQDKLTPSVISAAFFMRALFFEENVNLTEEEST